MTQPDLLAGSEVPARETARDLVANHVRRAVVSGELAPGAKLYVADFARQLGVSHTPAREAFQLLAAEGLLQISPYRGARVAELSSDEYEEIFLMRVGLEGLAARLGAERIGVERVGAMARLLDEMELAAKHRDVESFLEADREFHRIHYTASGRENLWKRIIGLRLAAERYTRVAYGLPQGGLHDTIASHRDILAAVEQHDGSRAESIIKKDLKRTFVSLQRELKKNPALGRQAA